MADNDDKQFKRLPVVLQTTAIKNFFEYTVDQLYSEANVETLNGFVGTPDYDGIRAEGAYIEEPTATKQAYSLSPTVNTISPETGEPESLIYYDEVVDIIKTYGVDVRNQNKIFDAPYFTFSPPINEDKLVNYSEYYWAPPGANVSPNAIIISGTIDSPVDVENDILGQQYYVHYGETANTTFRNGMVVTFDGLYVNPNNVYSGNTYVVEGVGHEIDLVKFDRNSVAPYDANTQPSYVVIERGAVNNNGWSRNNYWFHKNNWYDAGQVPPDRIYRAERPIIEFDHRLETFNTGTNFLQSVDLAVTTYDYNQVNGLAGNILIDGVDPAGKTMIFPAESPDKAPYVYLGVPFDTETVAQAYNGPGEPDPIEFANLAVEIAGEPGQGFVDNIVVVDGGKGYTPNVEIGIGGGNISVEAEAQGTVYKGIETGITSLTVHDPGLGYQSNTVSVSFTTDSPTGLEEEPVVQVQLDSNGSIQQLNVITRGGGYDYNANLSVSIDGPNFNPANVSVNTYESYLASVEVTTPGEGYTSYQSIVLEPVANVAVGDSVIINEGNTQKGNEYYYTEGGWILADTKRTPNDPPLFVIYDDTGTRMDDEAKYPLSDFAGNKIFSYATPDDIRDEDAANVAITLEQDPVLGFPLVYRPFKAASEIVFTNNLEHDKYSYTPLGAEESENILGYNFYHLLPEGTDADEDYFPYWKPSDRPFHQAIISRYQLSQIEIDSNIRDFFIGCIPNPAPYNFSKVDVKMYLNGKPVKGFTLNPDVDGYITVNDNVIFTAGDYVEIWAYSDTGLISMESASKYEVPIGWDRNIFKEDIRFTSEPEYLEHFKTQIESQIGFVGEALGQNNYQSTAQDTSYATEIVQSDSDVILAAYLLDDQPHNLIDALRFNSGEYGKYKARLKKCINEYYATEAIDENNIDRTLEMILREVIAFRVGKNVFNRTYMVPFGDNYLQEEQVVGTNQNELILNSYLDLSLIEHSLLVFATAQGSLFTDMLLVDRDYVIINYNPITIRLIGNDRLGSTITTKLYTAERDSAQCPPTPSVLGIYPLFQPEIITDDTFETPQEVLIGHDGSKTPTYGDARDQLLLDFEQRIYNAAKKEFREANSLPELNFFDIRPGEFRDTGFSYVEWYNLMRYHFSTWASVNSLDPVQNEFYDRDNPWTWNYRGTSDTYPGHWRGLYEYYYDTVRPHTHPWEMLGFTEQPLWWDDQYGTDYGLANSAMWDDLENGIIRQGPRENLTQDLWKLETNPYARPNLFKYYPIDANGNLIEPNKLPSGTVTQDVDYTSEIIDTNAYPIFAESFTYTDSDTNIIYVYPGIEISYSDSNVYVQTAGVLNYEAPPGRFEPQPISINLPNTVTFGPSAMPQGLDRPSGGVVGIAVNGIPIINPNSGRSEDNLWHYNEVFDGGYDYDNPGKYDETGGYQYYIVPPKLFGLEEYDATQHSPIIGWALDGLPIYGPYGYTQYNNDGTISDDTITNIKSPFAVPSGSDRSSNPGGNRTGLFVEDYLRDMTKVGQPGYAGTLLGTTEGENFAIRYGITPETNGPHWFYVQCQDDDGNAMFPYAVGGGVQTFLEGTPKEQNNVYANQFYGTPNDLGGVFKVTVTDCGYDYVAKAVVNFEGDGDNAQGYPVMVDGAIRNVVVNNQGKNYAWDTTSIEILGDGEDAKAEPIVIDGKITGVRMLNFGKNYTFATVVIKQVAGNDGVFPGQFADLTIPTIAEDNANGIVNDAVGEIVITNKGYGFTNVFVDINPAVSPNPPIPYPMGYAATAEATIETSSNNGTGNGYVDPNAKPIVISDVIEVLNTDSELLGASWRYSDGAPVENAWKYSENYPFAVAEGLLLGQPAQFATQFADPTKLFRAEVDSRQQLSTVTRERWQFTDPEQFRIHGERDAEGNFLTNIGYTQFTNSWLAFQGLETNIEFAPQLRTINMRLSHRMSGYIDKDTMTVRTDQYSATGTTPSLIIPQDNINVQVHSSPYKSRNFYTGIIIEKAIGGYKVRGFDRSIGTFPTLKIDKFSPSRGISVGGEPAPFNVWEANKFYKKNSIVQYAGAFYRAPNNLTTGADFDARLWNRLPSLPQINGASAEVWSKYLNQIEFVPYESLLRTPQEVVDLLAGMGAFQRQAGYVFDGFDYNTGDTIDWIHAAKQFLFWTTAKWEIGNTVELSPMAGGVTFKAPRGFIAKLNRIDRNQFTILDADGSAITPESCEIIRLDDYIQIKPTDGQQIYGVLVYVKEIEHAMTFENKTDFNDIIFDPVLHQYQTRVKIKGKRTAGWDGKFTSEGFIILDDELKPNLDNLAQSMGRYHELGFIPVEKQVYESARALFGYQSRAYLRDLDILDDQQFDFYKGFIQTKGTQTSMTRIGEANSIIIDGQIKVYDEWALKVGDFGDVESQQAIEFKLDRSNVTSDPQLVTFEFPEDITGVVERVDVINRNNTYLQTPTITISPPSLADGTFTPGGRQATAQAYLNALGQLDYIEMVDKGRGYEFATAQIVTQGGNNLTGNKIEFTQAIAIGGMSDKAWSEQPINGNCYIETQGLTIQFTEMVLTDDGFIGSPSNVLLFTNSKEIEFTVGDTITFSGLSGTVCKSDGLSCANYANLNGTFAITSSEVLESGTKVGFTSVEPVGYAATYGVSIVYTENANVMLEFDNVYYHEANIEVTPFLYGGKQIEDIINAETANTGVTASMFASHVPNERQPGQAGGEVIDWYTLVLTSDTEFTLVDESPSNVWTEQFHINAGTYRNQQRWAIDVASGTQEDDIIIIVDGQIVDQCKFFEIDSNGGVTGNCEIYNWNYFPGGDYTGNANVALVNQSLVYSEGNANGLVHLETFDQDPWVPADLDDETTRTKVNGTYPFLDLYIGNKKIDPEILTYQEQGNVNVPVHENVWLCDTINPGMITIYTEFLPTELVDANTSFLMPDLPIQLIEKASIKFTEDFNGDLYGSNISIDVTADDDLLCKIGRERTYEITKDLANDDIIVIDVDDPSRFLKKPTGKITNQLWPEYTDVNYLGVKDSKDYPTIPNAGYVNQANVNFQSYDIASLPLLFDPSIQVKPTGGHTIHIASSENQDWNVYELSPTNADVQFLARQDNRVSLFTNYSLFNYIDGNMIGEDDTGRYLDYYLTLRNADVSDNVIVWTNETIIQQAQSTITDLTAPRMIEARIRSIGPSDNSLRSFTDYIPIGDDYYNGVEMSCSGLEQGETRNIVTGIANVEVVTDSPPMESDIDPNTVGRFITLPDELASGGFGAEFSATWNTNSITGGFESTLANVTIVNAGQSYEVGDLIRIVPDTGFYAGAGVIRVTEVAATDLGSIPSNVITIGRIQNSTIQDGDVIRLITGGNYSYATVDNANISIDYDERTFTFSNVSNASDFVIQNTLNLTVGETAPNQLNRYTYTILDNAGNSVVVTSTSFTSSDKMNSITLGDFGTTNELRTQNMYDLGDPNKPNDTDTYYNVFNVNTGSTGTTTLQIERPDTFFNYSNVSSDVYDIEVQTGVKCVANVTGNVFSIGTNAIQVAGQSGALSAMNGVWVVFNVVQNPDNPNTDLVTFNVRRTLPIGTYSAPPAVYKTDTSLNLNMVHLNKTRLVMPNVSDINVGDTIKVLGNVFNGTYNADSVIIDHNAELNDNSFTTYVDIPAPYIFDIERSGNVLMGGMKITTTNPHGISPAYAAQNKRVAVHFAYPKSYNKFYNISRVTPYTIEVDDVLTQSDETNEFYRYETATVSRTNNIYLTTSDPLLAKTTVTYTSNSSIVAPNNFTVLDGSITFTDKVLPADDSPVTVNIIREVNRSFDRYPVLTTVDHNKIRLNGVNFTINSYNNPEAIVENINRAASLMRGWVTPAGNGMTFSFPMLRDYRTPVFAPDGTMRPAHTINNYGPYIRDKNTLAMIANDPDIDTGVLTLSSSNELEKDDNFNLGSIKVGPTKGATYFDTEEKTWMVWLQDGPTDTEGGYYPLGVYYEDQNRKILPKRKKIFKIIPPSHTKNGPILDTIPGSYPVERTNPALPGQTQDRYDLNAIKTYKFPALWLDKDGNEVVPLKLQPIQDGDRQPGTVKIYRYRLKPSTQGYYEVYEMVELTNGEIIGIKVDSTIPPNFSHNFFGTQSTRGNFFGLPSNSINFDSKISFKADDVDLYPGYGGGSITLGAVMPPADIGRTLIPEPFAFRRSGRTMGNGSDSILNWEGLPEIFASIRPGGSPGPIFTVTRPGFGVFNMWQPGLIPGQLTPPTTTSSTIGIPFGKGRGYYEEGDGNSPEMFQVITGPDVMEGANDVANITMGWSDPVHCPQNNPFTPCTVPPETPIVNDLPMTEAESGWYTPQPRFKYSKRFVTTETTSNNNAENDLNEWANSSVYYNSQDDRYAYKTENNDGTTDTTVFVNGNYPDPADTTFRPDEIFVACFWTERHTYKNQIVGYGPDEQNSGTRRPIIKDYQGTITRCKYLRMTELPLDAVLVKPECDTGWGGESLPNERRYITDPARTGTDNSTGLDLLTPESDQAGGTSDTQNNNLNTGADFTGGVSPEDPNPNEAAAFDIDNTKQLRAGYTARDNTLVEPGEQITATLPNTEARQAPGIGLDDLTNVAFNRASPGGEDPFDNSGTNVDESIQQNTSISYPTVLNSNGSEAPVANPNQLLLPGQCDIEPTPEGNVISTGGTCDAAPSSVIAYTAANNYYGIVLTGSDWATLSQETSQQKWEWHDFGKVANLYNGGTSAWIEVAADFRDDTLTAAGITIVQSRYPFGRLGGGQSFDPRNPAQSAFVNQWWESATVLDNLNTIAGATEETDMLQYGVDPYSHPETPNGRATGNNITSVRRIGLSQEEGAAYTPVTRPSNWDAASSEDWLCTDFIIGGGNRAQTTELGQFANHNAVKGAFGLRGKVDCRDGEYLTAFVHIGHGSGLNGTVVPRYDIWIRYNHNVSGYGGDDTAPNDVCEDGSGVNGSSPYTGGAMALAFKSQTTSSTDTAYKSAAAIKSSDNFIEWGQGVGKDDTNLLPIGRVDSWLFDNIYFPYQPPVRQGDETTAPDDNPDIYDICCDSSLDTTGTLAIYNSPGCIAWRIGGNCGGGTGGGGGGGTLPGGGGGFGSGPSKGGGSVNLK